jgi:hypothetical protein
MTASTALKWGLIGVALYAVYKWLAPSCKPGCNPISTAINAATTSIANSIVDWTTCSPITVNGNVQFPNGTQVAANSLPVGHDCQGNTFVQYQGGVYQLTGSAGCGVYTTTQIS